MNNKIEALRARKADGGFTLVEMLIVIVVLGILAGITVFGVASFRESANTAACNASAKTVEVAADAYRATTGAYPAASAIDDTHVLVTQDYIEAPGPEMTLTLAADGSATCTTTP